jgi:hypothetical protein
MSASRLESSLFTRREGKCPLSPTSKLSRLRDQAHAGAAIAEDVDLHGYALNIFELSLLDSFVAGQFRRTTCISCHNPIAQLAEKCAGRFVDNHGPEVIMKRTGFENTTLPVTIEMIPTQC